MKSQMSSKKERKKLFLHHLSEKKEKDIFMLNKDTQLVKLSSATPIINYLPPPVQKNSNKENFYTKQKINIKGICL
jgi:HD superfamily phosphohydrolase